MIVKFLNNEQEYNDWLRGHIKFYKYHRPRVISDNPKMFPCLAIMQLGSCNFGDELKIEIMFVYFNIDMNFIIEEDINFNDGTDNIKLDIYS